MVACKFLVKHCSIDVAWTSAEVVLCCLVSGCCGLPPSHGDIQGSEDNPSPLMLVENKGDAG